MPPRGPELGAVGLGAQSGCVRYLTLIDNLGERRGIDVLVSAGACVHHCNDKHERDRGHINKLARPYPSPDKNFAKVERPVIRSPPFIT